jgi:hypothetical protein
LTDEVEEIRELAKAVFLRIIIPRCGNAIFKTHFVELIKAATQNVATGQGQSVFSLVHSDGRRLEVYKYVMSQLDNAMKCDVLFEVVDKVLGAFLDDERNGRLKIKLPINTMDGNFILITDCLSILCCHIMRVSSAGASSAATATIGTDELEEADGKLMKSFWCKFLANHIMPTVLELKRLMEKERSSLLRYMEKALLLLISDYKDELTELMVDEHAQLLTEIEFDLEEGPKRGARSKAQEDFNFLSTLLATADDPANDAGYVKSS